MSNIQLVFGHNTRTNRDDEVVNNAACVPRIGEEVDTEVGTCKVENVKYDYGPNSGICRVYVALAVPNSMLAFS